MELNVRPERELVGGLHTDGISMSLHTERIVFEGGDTLHIAPCDGRAEIGNDSGRRKLAAISTSDPYEDGMCLSKGEYNEKFGHAKIRRVNHNRNKWSEHAVNLLSQNHSKGVQYSKIIWHPRAQHDTAKDRWFVATRTKEGNGMYRREHLDLRSYRLSRVTLDRFFERAEKEYTKDGKASILYYGQGNSCATGN